jgi:hypothetical protein
MKCVATAISNPDSSGESRRPVDRGSVAATSDAAIQSDTEASPVCVSNSLPAQPTTPQTRSSRLRCKNVTSALDWDAEPVTICNR